MLYVSKAIVLRGFAQLEEQEVRTNIERVKNSIDSELADLVKICGDWAPWDDSREFMLGRKPEYNTAGLTADCLTNLNLNFMVFVDVSGKIYHTVAVDPEKKEFVQFPAAVANGILANKSLLTMTEPNNYKSGLIILPNEIIMTAAMPISNSATVKPISGTLIMGRYLNERMIKVLSKRTQLDISVSQSNTPVCGSNTSVSVVNKDIIAGYANIFNLDGNKHITLKMTIPREIYNRGLTTVRYFTAAIISTIMVVLAALVFVLQKIVLKPINELTEKFIDIGLDYDADTKLYTERGDEIGSLARSFDSLMGSLRNRLSELQQSRNAATLLNSELVSTAGKLEQTNAELKNFAYIASHDLREPLRKISVFGEILQKSLTGKITGDDSENLNFMIDGAARMSKMIEGLLAYSRVSTKTHSAETVNLNNMVKEIGQLELSVAIEEKNAVIDVSQPLPEVEADPVQIRQLMQNLIANGMKYQAKGNVPHITISSRPAADGMVRINVADNGIGIKPEFQQAIFTMFKRLHLKNEYEGTGIGLAICKKIVERYGGQIGVESQPGKGSTFWFTLPASKKTVIKNSVISYQ
jgi:signal transduction histidine kinase